LQTDAVLPWLAAIADPAQRLALLARNAFAATESADLALLLLTASADPIVRPVAERVTRRRLAVIENAFTELGPPTRQARPHPPGPPPPAGPALRDGDVPPLPGARGEAPGRCPPRRQRRLHRRPAGRAQRETQGGVRPVWRTGRGHGYPHAHGRRVSARTTEPGRSVMSDMYRKWGPSRPLH